MHFKLRKWLIIADLCTVVVFSRGSTHSYSAHSYTQFMHEW